MKRTLWYGLAIVLLAQAAHSQSTHFLPGHLAILRAGDGAVPLKLKQSPVFIDQFDPATLNSAPSLSVPIPTNGANSFFINGHAATEGTLTRSADHKLLAFGGYGGVNLLAMGGTAARLDIQRGIATVDSAGAVHTYLYNSDTSNTKMNPRGAVTDGAGNFWGAGNANGTFYLNPAQAKDPVRFETMPNSRAIKIINNALYASLNGADAQAADAFAGIYRFSPQALPHLADTTIALAVRADTNYQNIVSFDINPAGDTAYTADTEAGIEKYVKAGGGWKLAYNIAIPQNIPADLNHATGCFGLAVDFSGTNPIVYATTTEGYEGSVNSNRVVRVVDTGASATVSTVAQSPSTDIVYRGIEFTPN
jgi:hypothetical protein